MNSSETIAHEYETLSAGNGFVRLLDWSTVVMTGIERQSFLHNMCTNDIRSLSAGEACEAFCTDVKGKIIAHVFVFCFAERLELLMVPGQVESLIAHLDRYIIREDVQLSDATAKSSWIYAGGVESSSERAESETPESGTRFDAQFAGLTGFFEHATPASGSHECSQEAWEILRIESLLPLFGIDFDSSNLPQEVNRDRWAIHFDKGCYLGQETVARIDALGHVNQKIVAVKFDGKMVPPVGGKLLSDGQQVGKLTSCCWSPAQACPLSLAMVRRPANEPQTQLDFELDDGTVNCSVVEAR